MDLFTHAVLGAAVAHATAPARTRLTTRQRGLLGAAAAAFPDIDFAGFPLAPLDFLADWHQGPTHSLLLLPLWAVLIAALFVRMARRTDALAEASTVAALAIASHIAGDLLTVYGTMLLYPLSRERTSLGTTFVIDPLFTAIVLAGLAGTLWTGHRWMARAGLGLLAVYVAAQAGLRTQALEIARSSAPDRGLADTRWAALPQPFSPFNWKLIASDGSAHHEAYVNLAGHSAWMPALPGLQPLYRLASAYRPPAQLVWHTRHRLGDDPLLHPTVELLWADPRFAAFRRFATHPGVSRIERQGDATCVWFTDLRYDLPVLPHTFRYGFCRERADAAWRLYRLRYFSERARQRIE